MTAALAAILIATVIVYGPQRKKVAGRLLDGRTHDEFPEVTR